MLFYFSLFSYPAKYITMRKKNGSADPEKKGPVKMSKFKKFFGVAAVVAAAAGVIAYFMKKDRSVEPEFETPNDDEEFEQDLKDLFDDYKEEAPAAKATGEQPEETSTEAKSQPEENEKEETAEETPATKIAKQEEAEEKKAPELEKPAETENKAEEIAVEAPAEEQK